MNEDMRLYKRVRYLPVSAEATMAKLARLRVEAEQLGIPIDILSDPTAFSAAWDREIEKAKLEAAQRGQETSMGVDHAS